MSPQTQESNTIFSPESVTCFANQPVLNHDHLRHGLRRERRQRRRGDRGGDLCITDAMKTSKCKDEHCRNVGFEIYMDITMTR